MPSARTFLFTAFLHYAYLTPIIAKVAVNVLRCATPADPPISDTIDCHHALDVMSFTPNPLEPAIFRDGDCVILLYHIYSQTPWADGTSTASPVMLPGRGPRPKDASFHPELFPKVVECARDLVQLCFDEPYSGTHPRRAGARGRPNTGGTSLVIGRSSKGPPTHEYGLEVFSAPRDMPKGIKEYHVSESGELTFHVYEAPTWPPSPRPSSPPGSPSKF